MKKRVLSSSLIAAAAALTMFAGAAALGVNWGLMSSHPLPPEIVVATLQANGFTKVKLFDADPEALRALSRSGIKVMVGIPNELLATLASSVAAAERWVVHNVSAYISGFGVDVAYVAVGNEPFLKTYMGLYEQTTFPALRNVQAALVKAGLSQKVKVTVPVNADVYQSSSGLPSGGDFRPDIHALMVSILTFLQFNGGVLTVNIYPFLSVQADPHFPIDYAFFDGGAATHLVDDVAGVTYTNAFDANFDTLIWSLEKNGFPGTPVVVGEVGWPTDGDANANVDYARRFNQGLLRHIADGGGTPKRPVAFQDVFIFSLLDEDKKSIVPGNFERHWGILAYDGGIKYPLVMAYGKSLTPSRGVKYLDRRWCVISHAASGGDPAAIAAAVDYACSYADCTSLSDGASCGGLDAISNASYAFNQFYQIADQQNAACSAAAYDTQLPNLVVTRVDPSLGTCKFDIMINLGRPKVDAVQSAAPPPPPSQVVAAARSFAVEFGSGFLSLLFTVIFFSFLS